MVLELWLDEALELWLPLELTVLLEVVVPLELLALLELVLTLLLDEWLLLAALEEVTEVEAVLGGVGTIGILAITTLEDKFVTGKQ